MKLEEIHQLIQQGQYEKALQASFDNIEAYPKEIENYINAGIILAEANEIEKSERFFQRAITLEPENGSVYYNFANVYFNENRFQDAIKLYQLAKQKGFDTKDTNFMIGLSFLQLDAKKEALPYLMRAAEIDEAFEDIELQFQYALVLCELELFDQAIPILNKILEINPQHADAQYNLTLAVYMKNEDIDVAIKGFERAILMDEDHLLSQHALKTFKAIRDEEG
ncbi:tetratricopeptide repeat protein [Staphylococcus sp. H16/1A]|uniref:Tetratricopeptide repeat protein n=2 Tax=Staphylococcus canis TaxID=2724942 RepID=A0ABS0TDL8_9STAP|nr:tetratricopeptide repeat protein [Staphylococcus canis]MBI5975853.1 tetratricopeptide repeat protein [Staphylococcus canis]